MLKWTVILAAALLVAFVFGYGGVAVSLAGVANILFCVFLVMFVATLLIGFVDGKAADGE